VKRKRSLNQKERPRIGRENGGEDLRYARTKETKKSRKKEKYPWRGPDQYGKSSIGMNSGSGTEAKNQNDAIPWRLNDCICKGGTKGRTKAERKKSS